MTQKQEYQFPENWENVSDDEAIKHIKYLLEHYQEYDMRKFGDNGIVINEIYFFPLDISLSHCVTFKYMCINWQKVYDSTEDIYPMIQQLIDVCNVEINKRKTEEVINAAKKAKKEKIQKNIVITVLFALLCAGVVCISAEIRKDMIKQAKIKEETRRYQKTLPHYNEYLQTQKQIQNYRDSLNRVYE